MTRTARSGLIGPGEPLKSVLTSLLRAKLKRLTLSMTEARRTDDAEALHQMRVSLRRLQAFLKVFRDCFPRKKLESYSEVLRTVLRLSGEVREFDLFISMVERHRKTVPGAEGVVLDVLIARKIRERRRARKLLDRLLKELNRTNFWPGLTRFLTGRR